MTHTSRNTISAPVVTDTKPSVLVTYGIVYRTCKIVLCRLVRVSHYKRTRIEEESPKHSTHIHTTYMAANVDNRCRKRQVTKIAIQNVLTCHHHTSSTKLAGKIPSLPLTFPVHQSSVLSLLRVTTITSPFEKVRSPASTAWKL